MTAKLVVAFSLLLATPMFAHAQQGGTPPGPKPTLAQVQKVVQIVSGDKAKTKIYCDIAKLGEQMDAAEEKKDEKKAQELSAQADALGEKLGPEYVSLMNGLEQIDPATDEGKAFVAALDSLNKLCGN